MVEKKGVYKFNISSMNSRNIFGCKVTYNTKKINTKGNKKATIKYKEGNEIKEKKEIEENLLKLIWKIMKKIWKKKCS